MQWTRVCISFKGSKANLVADETYLVATDVSSNQRPAAPILVLGGVPWSKENLGRISDFNMFRSSLPVERMIQLDLSWDDTEWTQRRRRWK